MLSHFDLQLTNQNRFKKTLKTTTKNLL